MAYETNRPLAPNVKGGPDYKPTRQTNDTGFMTKVSGKPAFIQYEDNGTKVVVYHNVLFFDGTQFPNLADCQLVTWEDYNGVL